MYTIFRKKRLRPSKRIGDFGENSARRYLQSKGHFIWKQNWRDGKYEIDLISLHDRVLIFHEVKTGGKTFEGFSLEGKLHERKLSILKEAAERFLRKNAPQIRRYRVRRVRFDGILVRVRRGMFPFRLRVVSVTEVCDLEV